MLVGNASCAPGSSGPCGSGQTHSYWAERAARMSYRGAGSAELDDFGVDRGHAERMRDRNPVMTVADEVLLAHAEDGDRRKRRAAPTGNPKPLPALAARQRWAEPVVELLGLGGLRRADDRRERDRAHANRMAVRRPRAAEGVIEGDEAARPAGASHQLPRHALAPTPPALACEGRLGI